MNAVNQSFNILLQVQSQNDAEKIISQFRAAGVATRAHRISSEEDFHEHLNDNSWDLLILDGKHAEVSTSFSIDAIKKSGQPIASILLAATNDEAQLNTAFKGGISAVVPQVDARFIQLAQREMQACQMARQFQALQNEFDELQSRAQKLLAESDDALAYISDGIIIQCNERFAEIFAYDDVDELDCASIIDLVADDDHTRFKTYIKHFSDGSEDGQSSLNFQGLKASGDAFEASLKLEPSTIDGEACTQFTISTGASSSESSAGSGPIDENTGLYNRYYLLEQMSSTALQVANGVNQASLLVFSIDEIDRIFNDVYISGTDIIIQDLGGYLKEQLSSGDVIGRVSTGALGLILQKSPDVALATAKDLLKLIEKHICQLPGRTVQFTCTCAILNLNNKNATFVLDQSVAALHNIRLKSPKNTAEIYTPQLESSATVSADDLSDIQEALDEDCFKLRYQPLMSLMGDDKENYEVQCFLEDASGLTYPEAMINSAPDSKLDRWIILEATKALALRIADSHDTRLIINLTATAIKDAGLAPWLGVAIKAANLNSESVVFQFREEDIRNNLKDAVQNITAIQNAGYNISIRDFGKGDEPFKLVQHLKLNFARFDEHFTDLVEKGDITDLQTLAGQAKEQEIRTILPKVANANAMATIWTVGCDFLTGDFVQEPQSEMNYVFDM